MTRIKPSGIESSNGNVVTKVDDGENLLFGITIGVINEVFRFLSPWDRECALDKYL